MFIVNDHYDSLENEIIVNVELHFKEKLYEKALSDHNEGSHKELHF